MGLGKRENSLFSRAKNSSKKKVFGQAILADDLLALRRLLVLKDTADFVVKGANAVVPFVPYRDFRETGLRTVGILNSANCFS